MKEMAGEQQQSQTELEKKPAIFVIGSPNVGKRTILSRLLSIDFDDSSSSDLQVHGWNINTKYYTADVSVWMAHLHDDFRIESLPFFSQLVTLVMIFDLNDLSTLAAIQDWVSRTDLQQFEILLCMGNKVDLIPGHPAHVEYRRRLQKKLGPSNADPFSEPEYGIIESEGTGLLRNDEQPSVEVKHTCLEWCAENNIEYIEVCASNPDFDRCLSVDGDLQGVERLYGAISAHMWPGMILKSGDKITTPSLPDNEDLSDEESDYEFEYEMLSGASAEPWDDTGKVQFPGNDISAAFDVGESASEKGQSSRCDIGGETGNSREPEPSTSTVTIPDEKGREAESNTEGVSGVKDSDKGKHLEFEELDQLMSEIGNVRNNLRLMPDFQRREMAAQLALKMAAMFGGVSDDEEDI